VRGAARGVAVAAACFLALTACGGGSKVGSAFKNFQGQQAGQRVGALASSPTPTLKAPAGQPRSQHAAAPAATQKPAAAAQPSALSVQITASGFDPTAARVYQGSLITVKNVDRQPHSYTASDITYDTGMLAPGQSKTFPASVAGKFQINDRSRNWIIGSLEVVRR